MGGAVAAELVLEMVTVRQQLDIASSGGARDDDALWLWSVLSAAAGRLDAIGAQDFPRAFETGKAEIRRLEQADLPEAAVALYRELFGEYFERYAYAQARLRAMIVALEGRLSGVRDRAPPAAANRELCDPFSGQPLQWLPLSKCAAVISVGANRARESKVVGTSLRLADDDIVVWACFER